MALEVTPLYTRAFEQLITPVDRNLMCQDADPQLVAQLLLGTYFSANITEWSPTDIHLEDRYDPQEPVTVRLISKLLSSAVPHNIVKLTAISPNKNANISILCNHSIILHSDLNIIIPPYKTKHSIANINNERFYTKLFKMRPRNARLHGAGLRCPVISPEEEILACSVSDYGDICIIHSGGDVAILDHVEFLPGRPYTYFFTSPFSMLSHREDSETTPDLYVVAYDCCFPPDSDNYLQCDSTLIVVRAIGRHTELKLERCVYSCSPCTIDDLAVRGGVRRTWVLRQMPTITFRVTFDSTMPLSLSCSISPFGDFAVLVYSGLHFSIPILHVSDSIKHTRQPAWSWSPAVLAAGAYRRQASHAPRGCRGCSLASLELDSKSEPLPHMPESSSKVLAAEKRASSERVPIPCRCNCLQLMPSFDAQFSNLLDSYIQWLETDNGSYVMTHNLHALIQAYMPHSLRHCQSEPVRVSWSLDGSIYCMYYAGVFIFGAIFGVLFRVELKDVTSAAVASGPMISFANTSSSLVGRDLSFEFLGGRFLAFRFGSTLTIFHVVLPFNKLNIEYPERWAPSTHTISACQLIRETPPVLLSHTHLETSATYAVNLRFIPQINTVSFLSYGVRNYKLLRQLLLSSSPLEAKELQEGLTDELNPNQSSDSMREVGVATEILLFFQAIGTHVSVAMKNMFNLLATLATYQNTIDYSSHLAKIASGAYSMIVHHACEAVLVPLNILRRRYTKDLSPISLVSAEQTYMAIVDSIISPFDGNILSFFYKQLGNYPVLFSSRPSNSLNGSSESSDIFTGESDDAEDRSESNVPTADTLQYTKALCFMAVSLLKLTALFVRTSYALSAARAHLLAPGQAHQLLYKNNRFVSYTIPAATCLSLACGYCCLAYDNCVYQALCYDEKTPARRELIQKAALFLLCIHSLSKCLQLYFLDSVVIQMLSILVPQNYTAPSGPFNKPQSVAVPLLPFYIINVYYPFMGPFSVLQSSSISLEKRFAGASEAEHAHFAPERIISVYDYLFSGTPIHKLDMPNNPCNQLYLQSVLSALKQYDPFPSQDVSSRTNMQQPLAAAKTSSIPTCAQILHAAYAAGRHGHFLAVISYLLKLSGDSAYCGPRPSFSSASIQVEPSSVCLTELQCSLLTRMLTICDTIKAKSPLAHNDIGFLLTLRARTDATLLDSLVFFLLYVTTYNVLLDFNYFLTFQRNAYTEPRCHCGSPSTLQPHSSGVAGEIRYSLTFPDTAYIDNLPPIIQPLFTPLCIALFLLAIGRIEDGVFLLARERCYSTAIHLLRCFLTSFAAISKEAPETIGCSQNASLADRSPIDESERHRMLNIYACKIPNLERLCNELETNQSALCRICGHDRDSVMDIDYSVSLQKEPEAYSVISKPTSRSLSQQSKRSVAKSHIDQLETRSPPPNEGSFPGVDDFHVNRDPEIGEVLSTSAVKADDIVGEKRTPPELDVTASVDENQRSSISSNPLQRAGLPAPPPLPPPSTSLSQQLPQPPPLPPPPGSVVAPVSTPIPPFSFQPQPSSMRMPPPIHYNSVTSQIPPTQRYLPVPSVNRSIQRVAPVPITFQPPPSRPASSNSAQRPLSVLTTSQIRPHSAYLPTAPESYASLPVHMPVMHAPGYPGNSVAIIRPHIPVSQGIAPQHQQFSGNLLNYPAIQIAPDPQIPAFFRQPSQQVVIQAQPQAPTSVSVPVPQQIAPPSQAQNAKPEHQKQKRMQPQIQSIEISSVGGGSTLSINDPYPPQRSAQHQMCSNIEIEEHTPPIFSPGVYDSGVYLGTQDYRNMAQYLQAAAPKQPEAPVKRKTHNNMRWMDISKNIEELDQLTAAAQGTMDYLQALTKEVEGNEQRLLRAKH